MSCIYSSVRDFSNHSIIIENMQLLRSQSAITCSKLTTETLEPDVKYVQLPLKTPWRRQWRHFGVFAVTLTIFYTLFQFFYC